MSTEVKGVHPKDTDELSVRSSNKSIRKRQQMEEVATKQKVLNLQHEFEEKQMEDEEYLNELQSELKVFTDAKGESGEEWDSQYPHEASIMKRLKQSIADKKKEMKKHERKFEMKKRQLLEKSQMEKDKIAAEEDSDQQLDSDDERIIRENHTTIENANSQPPEGQEYFGAQDNISQGYSQGQGQPTLYQIPVQGYQFHNQPGNMYYGNPYANVGMPFIPPPPPLQQAGQDGLVNQLTTALTNAFGHRSAGHAASDLPNFAGKPEEWPIFYNEFLRTSMKYRFEASENLIRLRKALKGAAKEAVLGLLDDPGSVNKIITILQNRFGRPEFILKSLFMKIKEADAPEIRKPETIIKFGTEVQNLVVRIKSMNETRYLNDISLLDELVHKLPGAYAEQWVMWLIENPNRQQNLEYFAMWMEEKVSVVERLCQPKIEDTPLEEKSATQSKGRRRPAGFHAASGDSEKRKRYCVLCNKTGHKIDNCWAFEKKPNDDKWKLVRQMGLCHRCLKKGHMKTECKSELVCEKDGCPEAEKHHTLLHKEMKSKNIKPPKNNPDDDKGESIDDVEVATTSKDGGIHSAASSDILPIIPIYVRGPKGFEKIYTLLDTGSSFTVLEADVAERLGLDGKKEKLEFTVFGDKRVEPNSKCISLEVQGAFNNSRSYPIKSVNTVAKLGLPGRTFDAEVFKRKRPHLRSMKAKSMTNAKPQMVIGINAGGLFAAREILESSPGATPAAIRSLIGWYVVDDQETVKKQFQFMCEAQNHDDNLHQLMKDFFSTEAFGVVVSNNNNRSIEDKQALELLKKNTVKLDKRYETCLLWRHEEITLPNSKPMAERRLLSMEKRMDKDPTFAKLCADKFKDYIDKGYLVPVPKTRSEEDKAKKWYLPWFFHLHPTKKPRLVFDAAAKVHGKSLNDYLLKGPDLLRPLPTVLMLFRRHLIAITGDIKEMFHQVMLRKEDRSSQTILFRGMERDVEPTEYEMSVLFFGSASSPCSAIFTKNTNAEAYKEKYPDAVRAINLDFYMDDYLGGKDTVKETIELRKQITEIHKHGGFVVTKWSSNSEEVLSSIPKEHRAAEDISFNDKSEIQMEKTLGLYWSPVKDEFRFKLNLSRVPEEVKLGKRLPTKREMASLIMSLFDPLGFIAPYKIRSMVILQEVWRSAVQWDDTIPESLAEKWKLWIDDLPNVQNVTVPRVMVPVSLNNAKSIELHCFCDASEEAFSAVVYARIDTGGSIYVSFIIGKSRVAPLQGLTIPRMELQAAVMGARLARKVIEAFENDIAFSRKVYWTDSKTVLSWVRSMTARLDQFNSNRVGEILEKTNVEEWKWVPTEHNAADDATRSNKRTDLTPDSRWLNAPKFLYENEDKWPLEKCAKPNNVQGRPVCAAVVKTQEATGLMLPDLDKFSSWFRLMRSTAMIFLAIRKMTKKGPSFITQDDMKRAEMLWLRKTQQESFPDELKCLKSKRNVEESSRLYTLSPDIDDNGIIILKGRIDNAEERQVVKRPPILDAHHRYTELMIDWFHRTGKHFGQERVINTLRQRAWILNCRAAVRRCWAKCPVCKQRQAQPIPPIMGQLPVARLEKGRPPFFHTGIDYFGPYHVKILRSTAKRWGVLFSCLTTRAVHLELAESLDTNDFMNALVRFINLRGNPCHIWSDNGTNFKGAEREIKECLQQFDQEKIRSKLSAREIEWHFIPPASPHMGGSWERFVGSVKKILSQLLKEDNPKEGVLRTLFTEVTAILNSRPLTRVSPDPNDEECLTPNHLLHLPCIVGPTILGNYTEDERFRKSWRLAQQLADSFWKRWAFEYLPWLAKRQKWIKDTKPVEVGEVVLVLEDTAPRNQWKKGIIAEVYPSKDGQVRAVMVKIAYVDPHDRKKVKVTFLKRPVVKICRLGLTGEVASEVAGREECSSSPLKSEGESSTTRQPK